MTPEETAKEMVKVIREGFIKLTVNLFEALGGKEELVRREIDELVKEAKERYISEVFAKAVLKKK